MKSIKAKIADGKVLLRYNFGKVEFLKYLTVCMQKIIIKSIGTKLFIEQAFYCINGHCNTIPKEYICFVPAFR